MPWGMAVTAVLVLLVSADLWLRFMPANIDKLRELITAAPDDRVYILRPGANIRFDGLFSRLSRPIVWSINQQGYREDRMIAPLTRRYRVAAYGDSETFGWSVSLEETFQRRMEFRDARVEVVNLGVPGYNAANVARHIESTFEDVRPDAILYLVNRNDVDEALITSRTIADSPLLRRLRFLYQMTVAKPARLRARRSPERAQFFAEEAGRIARFGATKRVPVIFGFLRWRTRSRVEARGGFRIVEFEVGQSVDLDSDRPVFVNVQPWVKGDPEEDSHMIAMSHEKMAALFCEVISGNAGSGCLPSDWAGRTVRRSAGQSRDG